MLVPVVPRVLALLVVLSALGASLIAAPARADTVVVVDSDPSALVVWRDRLDPYGAWVTHERYGWVWVPHRTVVGVEFAPYVSAGRWALSEEGDWVWVSDYPFGPVVFHYGRWVWTSDVGWVWIPGLEYAPAWVVWRVPDSGYAYVGWAPAPPSYIWVDGVAVSVWYRPVTPYVFCHTHHVFSYGVHRHIIVDRHHIHEIGRHTVRYRPAGPRRGPTMTEARVAPRDVPRIRHAARPIPRTPGASSDRHAAAPVPRTTDRHAASPAPAQPSGLDSARRSAPRPSGSLAVANSTRPANAAPAPSSTRESGVSAPAPRPADGVSGGSAATRAGASPAPVRTRPNPRAVEPRAQPSAPVAERRADAPRAAPARAAAPTRSAPSGRPSVAQFAAPSRSPARHASPSPARAAPPRGAPAARARPAPSRTAPTASRRR